MNLKLLTLKQKQYFSEFISRAHTNLIRIRLARDEDRDELCHVSRQLRIVIICSAETSTSAPRSVVMRTSSSSSGSVVSIFGTFVAISLVRSIACSALRTNPSVGRFSISVCVFRRAAFVAIVAPGEVQFAAVVACPIA